MALTIRQQFREILDIGEETTYKQLRIGKLMRHGNPTRR